MQSWLVISVLFISSFTFTANEPVREVKNHSLASSAVTKEDKAVPAFVLREPLELKVILNTYENDNLVDTKEKVETIWAMEDFWAQYDGWVVEDQRTGQITFKRELEIA
ncbi:BofC N-terminal domain-containing protein [Halobacillus sp. Marseille-Q1614]|uniref:BofC N-terminal domain-containing protein n=1 Tax=Halobacillus sp. Marseille-Q1614 TaxID=2709134 RepID=UPI00156D607D|nr:BofC N-terminal domain-containing protein [Halobacillus sp. Marseille-Q1614]